MTRTDVEILGVGAGPSNLALAVALEELAPPALASSTLLLERGPRVEWQSGLLIPWVQSQVSFLKDLVTLRNPRSAYTFVNFLHDQGRLDDFMSLGTFTPYRSEISDYLQWVSRRLEQVRLEFDREVVDIEPVRGTGHEVAAWRVSLADGAEVTARHLVVGCGRNPRIPEPLRGLDADRVVHSSRYRQSIDRLPKDAPRRVVVVGGAQSAVEMVQALSSDLPGADTTLLVRSVGLTPYASSPFTSRFYSTAATGEFYDATPEGRAVVLEDMRRSNYAGVTPDLLEGLHRRRYLEGLNGKPTLDIRTSTELVAASVAEGEVSLTLRDRVTGEQAELVCDLILLGTGYETGHPQLVGDVLATLGETQPRVTRSYRLDLAGTERSRIYVQGTNEDTHGIADSLLSVLARRSEEIVLDLLNG